MPRFRAYSPGFSVGVIGDMYLNPYFKSAFYRRLSISVTRNLCSAVLKWKEWKGTDENPVVSMYSTSVRSNYLTFPLDVKYSAFRVNNYRPYLIGGIYGAFDLGRKKRKSDPVERNGFRLSNSVLDVNIYLPFFKLLPGT